jgi:2'-5' RNA ligase
VRTFLAFEVPSELRQRIDDRLRPLRDRLPRARWVEPAAMHLTLVFLGEVDDGTVSQLQAGLTAVFAAEAPVGAHLGGIGAFPEGKPPRVIWLAVELSRDLAGLQRRALEPCVRAGAAPDEKPFRPHLTLARCAPPWPARALETLREASEADWNQPFSISEAVFFHSRLGAGGARHEPLFRVPLSGAA